MVGSDPAGISNAGFRVCGLAVEAAHLASIAGERQKVPMLVAQDGETYQVLDGFRRRNELEQLGCAIVLAV
jgi:hypothetical protein